MNSDAVGWEFPLDTADQWEGFNDPGIEHFRGDPFGSLTREILQNSLDAAVNVPVIVKFINREIAVNDIPDIDHLRSAINACLKDAPNEGPKAEAFFVGAAKILRGKRLQILSISEENTSGIAGPCRNGKPYFAFVKATGQ